MAEYRDNFDPTDDLDSITLRELEPMNSNPYVRISLDSLDSSSTAADRERRRRREAERIAEAERQKKAAKKRKQQESRQKSVEPSLHVIIERAPEDDLYADYGYSQPLPYASSDGRDGRDPWGYQQPERTERRDPYEARTERDAYRRQGTDSYDRSSNDLEQFASKFPSIPNNLMYGVDEPTIPSSPIPREQPSANQPGYQSQGAFGAAAEAYPFGGYVSQPLPMRQEPISAPEPTVRVEPQAPASAARTSQSDAPSGFIKRPWSESAFNEHTASAPSASAAAPPVATNNPRAAANAAAQSPTVNIPSVGVAPSAAAAAGRVESRPFNAAPAADPYASNRGMGSWKRSAADPARRDATNNPRTSPRPAPIPGTVQTTIRSDATSLNIPMPPQRQTNIQTYGAPLIDEAAVSESAMFDESPVSIADGMKHADKKRKRRRGIIIAIVAVLVAVAAAVAFLVYSGTLKLDSIVPGMAPAGQSSAAQGSSGSGQASSGAASSGRSSSSSSSSNADQSGTVIYEYTATTSDGVSYTVNDTVTFGADGKCQTTHMVVGFPDAAACDDFLANLERDYGSDYALDSHDGANATVTIDISSLKFDREEYEDALRYSVEDLTVLKK